MDIWIALRGDQQTGSGTASDPFEGGLSFGRSLSISLTTNEREATADTGNELHGFSEGDSISIVGVTGGSAGVWNRIFVIYDVHPTTFSFGLGEPAQPASGKASRIRFLFDEVMHAVPPNMKVNIGP